MMRRVVNGTDALETINAAATVIASMENHVPRDSVQKRRWGSCLNIYSCFGSHKNNKRLGHAVVPETMTEVDAPSAEHSFQPPSIVLPFVAPPSSPASYIPSEPPSSIQSPTGILSLTSVSANMYSPGGPASIFTIGPYAHETQLVSPPVFSTFTTEPSTEPYTPPPESVHLTTPSSPEVPFARLLEPNLQNGEAGQRYPFSQYEFQTYQFQPGSPVSHLISPCSGISGSGTSSPFPDREFSSAHPFLLQFKTRNPPTILDLDKIFLREWEMHQGSGAVTPDSAGPRSCEGGILKRQYSDVDPLPDIRNNDDNTVVDHRVSFEITTEEIIRCVEKNPMPKDVPESVQNMEHKREVKTPGTVLIKETSSKATVNLFTDGDNEKKHQKNRTITLGSSKEFNFNNIDGVNSDEHNIGSDWWANEKVLGEEVEQSKNWSFFPMVETGVN